MRNKLLGALVCFLIYSESALSSTSVSLTSSKSDRSSSSSQSLISQSTAESSYFNNPEVHKIVSNPAFSELWLGNYDCSKSNFTLAEYKKNYPVRVKFYYAPMNSQVSQGKYNFVAKGLNLWIEIDPSTSYGTPSYEAPLLNHNGVTTAPNVVGFIILAPSDSYVTLQLIGVMAYSPNNRKSDVSILLKGRFDSEMNHFTTEESPFGCLLTLDSEYKRRVRTPMIIYPPSRSTP